MSRLTGGGVGALGCLAVLIVLAIVVFVSYFWACLAVGTAFCWFGHMDFNNGWNIAREQPIWAMLGWFWIFGGGLTALAGGGSRNS